MSRLRKGLSLLVIALFLGMALVACGGTTDNPGGASPTTASGGSAAKVTLTIESWRSDDQKIWTEQIIPAFEKSHPDIHVEFKPTAPT
jgi:ABC-type glycerol-3-phosphate transport system substrate-binding protein